MCAGCSAYVSASHRHHLPLLAVGAPSLLQTLGFIPGQCPCDVLCRRLSSPVTAMCPFARCGIPRFWPAPCLGHYHLLQRTLTPKAGVKGECSGTGGLLVTAFVSVPARPCVVWVQGLHVGHCNPLTYEGRWRELCPLRDKVKSGFPKEFNS